jgi:hypothetical protein
MTVWTLRAALCGLVLTGLLGLLASGCGHGRGAAAQDLALSGQAMHVASVEAVGLAAGRDVAHGPEQLWMAEGRGVHRLAADGSSELAWKPPAFSKVLRFEVADLDADGVDEWVLLLDQGRLRSVVVGLREGERVALGRPWNGYLRPLIDPEGEIVLVGQRAGADGPWRGPVWTVAIGEDWALEPGEQLGLPPTVPVYDFLWLPATPDKPARLFSLGETGHLEERDPRSPRAVIWRSDDRFVGRPVEVERDYRDMLGDERETMLRLAPPVSLVQEDGVTRLLLVGGVQTPVVVFENLRVYQGGDARLLEPVQRGVEELRRSPLLGRAMVALAPWEPTPGERVWAAVVWTKTGSGFVKPESRVFLLDPATGDLVGSPQ